MFYGFKIDCLQFKEDEFPKRGAADVENDLWHRFHVEQMSVFFSCFSLFPSMMCCYTFNSIETIYQPREGVEWHRNPPSTEIVRNIKTQ